MKKNLLTLILFFLFFHLKGQNEMTVYFEYPDTSITYKYSNLSEMNYDEYLLIAGYFGMEKIANFKIKKEKRLTIWKTNDTLANDTSIDWVYYDTSGLITDYSEFVDARSFIYNANRKIVLSCYGFKNARCDTSYCYIYNDKQQLIEQIKFDTYCCGDHPPKTKKKYFYDTEGHLIKTEKYWFDIKTNSFIRGSVTVFSIDSLGRRYKKEIFYDLKKNDNNYDVTWYKFDNLNRIILDSNKNETYQYKYGENGFLIEKRHYTQAVQTPLIISKFIYNNKNQLIEKASSASNYFNIKISNEYDSNGKISKSIEEIMDNGKFSKKEHNYFYLGNGLLSSIKSTGSIAGSIESQISEYEFY